MAPKKDKQKETTKQPKPSQSLRILPPSMSQNKPELPNQLVPYPSSTPLSVAQPIPVANQFSALGSTVGQIRPSYQSTLISSYDPYSASSSVAFKKTSPYLPKSNFHLFVIEPNYNVNSDPLIRHFTKKAKFSQVDLFFPKQMIFVARYKVPWILKWSYRVTKDTRIFARQFSVKWWDKFEVDRIAKYVYNDLPLDPIPRPRQRPTSPTDSVRSSLSVGGKSKSELQEIARQLIIQASQMEDDEENDSDRDSPSPPSCLPMQQSPAKPKSWYEDSQDPYDAYDLGSD
ncbi:unnamed protein product [Prunus brigantina]